MTYSMHKILGCQLAISQNIVHQRILQFHWTRGTPEHPQPEVVVLGLDKSNFAIPNFLRTQFYWYVIQKETTENIAFSSLLFK